MILKELIDKIEEVIPLSSQEEWDNSGFQLKLHNDDYDIKSVYVCLEITSETIEDAISKKSDLIITHHPLIFDSLKQINIESYVSRMVMKAINHGISIYSTHTCFDICDGGNGYYFGKVLGLDNICRFENDPSNCGWMAKLNRPLQINDIINLCEEKFNVNRYFYQYVGPKDLTVKKIGWITGAGSEFLDSAKENGCDLFITGDLKYHYARDAKEQNMPILDIGHYASEMIFIENMVNLLKLIIKDETNIYASKLDINPFTALQYEKEEK